MRFRLTSACLLSLTLLSGCATVDKPEAPQRPTVELQQWVQHLQSPALTKLIRTATEYNPSIEAASARLAAANARRQMQGASLFPSLAASAQAGRSKSTSQTTANSFQLGADVSWQVDLWNRLGLQYNASKADTAASEADWHAAHLSLAAEIARSWFSTIEAAAQHDLAMRRVASFEATTTTIRSRFKAGVGDALDVRLAQENLATALASEAATRRAYDASLRQLEVLAGLHPYAKLKIDKALPTLSDALPAGLSATLLARRPDIAAAQQRLLASALRQKDAGKNHLPSLTLTGSSGTATTDLSDLLDFDSLVWSIAASISQNLFDGGRLSAEKLLANANHREVIANYTQTVLTALREVETFLAAEPLLSEQEQSTTLAVEESRAASQLALSRYKAGLSNIITLLDTQRRSFSAESNLLNIRLVRLQNRINLHLALGGDYANNNSNTQGLTQ